MGADELQVEDLAGLSGPYVRSRLRAGRYTGHTAGLVPGNLQCNLVIVPKANALDFLMFCLRNPQPCPVVGVSNVGDPHIHALGEDLDVRTDLPKYQVFVDGALSSIETSIEQYWRADMVAVALGCSFTFDNALQRAGLSVRHMEARSNVPMYRTNLPLNPSGPFAGTMVVSMRPFKHQDLRNVFEISARYPRAHGMPVAVGEPEKLGILDLDRPDYGNSVTIKAGEIPVFWACGVTPQNTLQEAKLPLCITHAPGHMLITDVQEDADVHLIDNLINQEGNLR